MFEKPNFLLFTFLPVGGSKWSNNESLSCCVFCLVFSSYFINSHTKCMYCIVHIHCCEMSCKRFSFQQFRMTSYVKNEVTHLPFPHLPPCTCVYKKCGALGLRNNINNIPYSVTIVHSLKYGEAECCGVEIFISR